MAQFLLPPDSNAGGFLYEVLLKLMRDDQQQITVFRMVPQLYSVLRKIASKYKADIPNYHGRLREIRRLKLVIRKKSKEDIRAEAYFDPPTIILYNAFFTRRNKAERIAVLEHEFTHMIQSFFEGKRKWSEHNEDLKYEHDFYEIEAISRDIFVSILEKRSKGRLRRQQSVANFIRENKFFKRFKRRDKKKAFKKIMMYVFVYKETVRYVSKKSKNNGKTHLSKMQK